MSFMELIFIIYKTLDILSGSSTLILLRWVYIYVV